MCDESNDHRSRRHEHDRALQLVLSAITNPDLQKIVEIIARNEEFPTRQREEKIPQLATDFLSGLKQDIHQMITDLRTGDDYRGLDSNRDTEAEVETALRFFPKNLSRLVHVRPHREDAECPPILFLSFVFDNETESIVYNAKGAPFIPLFARLGNEFDWNFLDYEGGILFRYAGKNIIQRLVDCSSLLSHDHDDKEEQVRTIDDMSLRVMIRLRQMNLLKVEHIEEYGLVMELCRHLTCNCFMERCFRFLVEWDPNSLLWWDGERGFLPLHWAASTVTEKSFEIFRTVFMYGIRYFPTEFGIQLLFQKSNDERTPLQIAFKAYQETNDEHFVQVEAERKDSGVPSTPDQLLAEARYKQRCQRKRRIMNVVEDTLNNSDVPLNVTDAFKSAILDEYIHFDCVYILLRREPNIIMNLLASRST